MAVLACTVGFSSCDKDDPTAGNGDGMVRFSAEIRQAMPQTTPVSRAAGTNWASDDAIGIFMVGHGGTADVQAANRQHTTTSGANGTLSPVPGNEIYYPVDNSAVDFIAYYPWKSGSTLGTSIDASIEKVQTTVNQPSFDLLYSAADNGGIGYTKTMTGAVALEFEHVLSKIVMKTTADASIGAPLTGMTVSINGMNTATTFELATGRLGTTTTPAPITPRTITDGSQYDAIIMPGSYPDGAVTVSFTVGDETFTWDAGAIVFEGGNESVYEVTITRTGVSATGTIKPWETVNKGGVTAD